MSYIVRGPGPSSGIAPGVTEITNGTPNGLLWNDAGTLGNLSSANNGVLVTNGSGVPSISSTLPTGIVATDISFLGGGGAALKAGVQSGSLSAWANQLLELASGDLATLLYTSNGSSAQLSGIYPYNVSSFLGLSTRISAANDPPNWQGTTTGDVPRTALTTLVTNSGAAKPGVSILCIANATASNTKVFGTNPIAMTTISDGTVTLIGTEIDIVWPSGTTPATAAGSGGLIINGLNSTKMGQGLTITTGGDAGSRWDNGIAITNITGASIYAVNGSPSQDTFMSTTGGTFSTAAILLGNTHNIRFNKVDGSLGASLAMNSGNSLYASLHATGIYVVGDGVTTWTATSAASFITNVPITALSYIEGAEQSAPAAPAANGYRIFAQDSGGKTQLMVRFASGASQQIAIEP